MKIEQTRQEIRKHIKKIFAITARHHLEYDEILAEVKDELQLAINTIEVLQQVDRSEFEEVEQ
jgi:hypothetical protein